MRASCSTITFGMAAHAENVEALSNLATFALTSPHREERVAAANQLRFLSSFDSWSLVKELVPIAENQYLRFILLKAIAFIVNNEIGPEERSEILDYLLTFMRVRTSSGQGELPRFLRAEVYAIIASSFYSNWKYTILSSNMPDDNVAIEAAQRSVFDLLSKLTESLPPLYVLEALRELISLVTRQFAKQSIDCVNRSAVNFLLPHILQVVVESLVFEPSTALEVCCDLLNSIPAVPTSSDAMGQTHYSNPVRSLICFTMEAISTQSDVEDESLSNAAQILQFFAATESPEFQLISEPFTEDLLSLSMSLLEASPPRRVEFALSVMSGILAREPMRFLAYIENSSHTAWPANLLLILRSYRAEEEEIQNAILHFYVLLQMAIPGDQGSTPPRVEVGPRGGISPSRPTTRRPKTCDVPPHLCEAIRSQVLAVFQAYLQNVIRYGFVKEGSQEVQAGFGIMLHNEKMLTPLSELLFCDSARLLPVVEEKLKEVLGFYRRLVAMRERLVSYSTSQTLQNLWTGEDISMLTAFMESIDDGPSSTSFLNEEREVVCQCLTRCSLLCLSHLSIIISIFAIAMMTGRVPNTLEVLQYVTSFAGPLLSDDHRLTSTLLEHFTLDESNRTVRRTAALQWSASAQQLHYGVIRSLFFFCYCLFGNPVNDERLALFYQVALGLLRFVYTYHSQEPTLVSDANLLLLRTMSFVINAKMFLDSDKMISVLNAIRDDRVALLHGCPEGVNTELYLRSRSSFLTAMTLFIETRYYAGYDGFDVLEALLVRETNPEKLRVAPVECVQNLLAMLCGCREPDTFQLVIDYMMDRSAVITTAIRSCIMTDGSAATIIVKWCAKACSLASKMCNDSGMSYFTYELCSFVLNAMVCYFKRMPCGSNSKDVLGLVPPNDSHPDVEVLYAASKVLGVLCGSCHWCRLGVVMHYERGTVEDFFSGMAQLVIAVPVELIMSDQSKRRLLFNAIYEVLESTGTTLDPIILPLVRQGVLEKLLSHLTACLAYTFCSNLLSLLHTMVHHYEKHYYPVLSNIEARHVSEATYCELFRQVMFVVSTAPHLELSDLQHCFSLLSAAFAAAPQQCTKLMADLLEFCSAYHRVRLRCIQSMLSQNRQDMVEAYIGVFGQSSKVGVLAPW